ncbi:hypothetical protein ACQP2P_32960 [Dactylosporangium sp. CA-139114]|uniref:hypothetical protein n=1 Tax=Dactylosporangium sp. CA-139114 TaxID=3239931 RepID=UPI003D98E2A2
MISALTLPIERYRVMAHIDGDIVAPGDGGIDVFETLLPVNRFLAGPAPSTVPIASCPCCGFEDWHDDATIVRDGDLVRRTFREREFTFAADAYDAEVRRAAEEPSPAHERLILNDLALPHGLFAARPWSRPRDGRRPWGTRCGSSAVLLLLAGQ